MTDLMKMMEQNRMRMNAEVDAIRANPRLSPEGKRDYIGQLYSKAMEQHQTLMEQHNASLDQEREKMHGELFTPSFTISQPDYQRDGMRREYRKNLQEADEILFPPGAEDYDAKALLRYLEMAELASDELAQRAAFAVSSNRGVAVVAERYLEKRPEVAERYQQYKQLDQSMREPTPGQRLEQMFEMMPPVKPDEAQDYRDGSSAMSQIFGGGNA